MDDGNLKGRFSIEFSRGNGQQEFQNPKNFAYNHKFRVTRFEGFYAIFSPEGLVSDLIVFETIV